MLKSFRDFILRGNVLDLAVAVVIGASFGAVVTSFTNDVFMQIISAFLGKPDFKEVVLVLNNTPIRIGNFVTAAVAFLIVASAIYFGVILPVQWLTNRLKKAPVDAAAAPTTKTCAEGLSEIPLAARRCAHCAQPQPALNV